MAESSLSKFLELINQLPGERLDEIINLVQYFKLQRFGVTAKKLLSPDAREWLYLREKDYKFAFNIPSA
jgi:hypothetical protein